MRCSGVKAKVHYHSIVIMNADGNQALAKMEMEKMVPKVMEELSSISDVFDLVRIP